MIRQLLLRFAVGGAEPDLRVRGIVVHVVGRDIDGDPVAIGGDRRLAEAFHLPEVLDGDRTLDGFLAGMERRQKCDEEAKGNGEAHADLRDAGSGIGR